MVFSLEQQRHHGTLFDNELVAIERAIFPAAGNEFGGGRGRPLTRYS
jgi:hypothetical protein